MTNINDLDLANLIQTCYKDPDMSYHGVEARIEHKSDYQMVAIRGTTDVRDWMTSLSAWIIPARHIGFVHAGFYTSAIRAIKDLICWLDKDQPVYMAGHSKGGPEAIILARLLEVRGFQVNKVVTFGAPEFITRWGLNSFDNLMIRQYRNGGDLVPLLPSRRIKLLRHARPLIHIGDKGAPVGLYDHGIGRYINALSDSGH